ncbi:uncharacterized protein BDW47DRAFT_126261 [Aspergillus candidus]|uniref:Uncharacterized protein n=1 Tax=Aspergillus candidus TaxID=41067 RepID=A0A2I2FAA8_ASPCN|nr:hypothetical protein BDW47DRAFT_126261 [Aspergillus candidus]PLB37563.1 hypothetical protein BDW47DRAFT_126261 [Aspergillus candidus]
MALGVNPIDFTEPIETTTYECEQVFQKAIKAWEEKYLDDPLVEDANSPDMIWLYSYHEILSRGIACLQRRRRLIEGQPASLTNKVDEEEEEKKKKKKEQEKEEEQEEEEEEEKEKEKEKEKKRWRPFL